MGKLLVVEERTNDINQLAGPAGDVPCWLVDRWSVDAALSYA
jgi:hypothetical protein